MKNYKKLYNPINICIMNNLFQHFSKILSKIHLLTQHECLIFKKWNSPLFSPLIWLPKSYNDQHASIRNWALKSIIMYVHLQSRFTPYIQNNNQMNFDKKFFQNKKKKTITFLTSNWQKWILKSWKSLNTLPCMKLHQKSCYTLTIIQ